MWSIKLKVEYWIILLRLRSFRLHIIKRVDTHKSECVQLVHKWRVIFNPDICMGNVLCSF